MASMCSGRELAGMGVVVVWVDMEFMMGGRAEGGSAGRFGGIGRYAVTGGGRSVVRGEMAGGMEFASAAVSRTEQVLEKGDCQRAATLEYRQHDNQNCQIMEYHSITPLRVEWGFVIHFQC